MPKKCLLSFLIIAWSFFPPAAASAEEFTAIVVDAAGEPVPDATVRVYEARARCARLFDEAVTDDAGAFTAERPETLEPMTLLWVTVSKDGFALCWFTLIGDRQPAAVIVLERPVVMSGIVLREDGEPIAGAEVRAMLLGGEGFGRRMIVGRKGVREAVTYCDADARGFEGRYELGERTSRIIPDHDTSVVEQVTQSLSKKRGKVQSITLP